MDSVFSLLLLALGACHAILAAPPLSASSSSATSLPTTSSNSTHIVAAHVIVGNTGPYTQSTWEADIALAASKNIDAFALNMGNDSSEPGQVTNAYAAAKSSSTNFKLFMSFDMSTLPCDNASNAALLQNYTRTFAKHPNRMTYGGKVLVSTFLGDNCTFGQSSAQAGWNSVLKGKGMPGVYFVPSFSVDPGTLGQYPVIDGLFNFGGGWPQSDKDIDWTADAPYIKKLGNKAFMAAVSPWFFTHYSAASLGKNSVWRSDDWLLSSRWDLIMANRNSVSMVEVLTWNDYGESHYMGPVEGQQPGSQQWANGYNHTDWLDLNAYYAEAYKTGAPPKITKDKVYMWARLQPANATASNDPIVKPTNWQWTQDYLWSVVQLTDPANVTLSCLAPNATGTISSTTNATSATSDTSSNTSVPSNITTSLSLSASNTTHLPSGLSRLKLPLTNACSMKVTVSRGGTTVLTLEPPGMKFDTSPTTYNFNAFVAASP